MITTYDDYEGGEFYVDIDWNGIAVRVGMLKLKSIEAGEETLKMIEYGRYWNHMESYGIVDGRASPFSSLYLMMLKNIISNDSWTLQMLELCNTKFSSISKY